MPLIRHQDKIAFFVHIPKTGGTSVEEAMVKSGAVVALRYGSRFNGFMKATFQHLNAEIHTQVIPAAFYDYAFATVRHPVARLVSAYYYRVKREASPPAFDRWVNEALDAHARNAYALDNHIRPQVDFLTPDVDVFAIEKGLTPVFKALTTHLGLPALPPDLHINRSKNKQPVHWTNETRDRTLAFYAKDFENLSYDPAQQFDEVDIMPASNRGMKRLFWT